MSTQFDISKLAASMVLLTKLTEYAHLVYSEVSAFAGPMVGDKTPEISHFSALVFVLAQRIWAC